MHCYAGLGDAFSWDGGFMCHCDEDLTLAREVVSEVLGGLNRFAIKGLKWMRNKFEEKLKSKEKEPSL